MISNFTFSLNSSYSSTQGYSFYTSIIDDSGAQLTIDIHADSATQRFVPTLVLDNTPYVSPGNVSSFPSTGVGQTTTKASSASSYTTSWRIMSLVYSMTVLRMVLWLQPKKKTTPLFVKSCLLYLYRALPFLPVFTGTFWNFMDTSYD